MTRATQGHTYMSCEVICRSSSFVSRAKSMMQLLKAVTSCEIFSEIFVACPVLVCLFSIQLAMRNPFRVWARSVKSERALGRLHSNQSSKREFVVWPHTDTYQSIGWRNLLQACLS